MSDTTDLRISDDDRERAVREIQEHFAAGRLTQDELDERVQAAYRARTQNELGTIRRDLPRLPPSPAQRKAQLAERRGGLQRRLVQEAGGGIVLFAACAGIWLADGAHGQFWPVWIALVSLLPLLRSGWRLYGPAPEFDRVERELESREHRRTPGGCAEVLQTTRLARC